MSLPDHEQLKALHSEAVDRTTVIREAIEARRVIDWLETYLPAKAAAEDRFSVELHLDADRTSGADEARRYLEWAIMSLAPQIITTAKEMAAQKVGKAA